MNQSLWEKLERSTTDYTVDKTDFPPRYRAGYHYKACVMSLLHYGKGLGRTADEAISRALRNMDARTKRWAKLGITSDDNEDLSCRLRETIQELECERIEAKRRLEMRRAGRLRMPGLYLDPEWGDCEEVKLNDHI